MPPHRLLQPSQVLRLLHDMALPCAHLHGPPLYACIGAGSPVGRCPNCLVLACSPFPMFYRPWYSASLSVLPLRVPMTHMLPWWSLQVKMQPFLKGLNRMSFLLKHCLTIQGRKTFPSLTFLVLLYITGVFSESLAMERGYLFFIYMLCFFQICFIIIIKLYFRCLLFSRHAGDWALYYLITLTF